MTHLGEGGVGVGQPRLRPRPVRVVAGRADRGGGVGQQRGRDAVVRVGRAAPRPRPDRRRPSRAARATGGRRRAVKATSASSRIQRRRAAGRGGAQAPQRPPPPVAEARLVGPAPVVGRAGCGRRRRRPGRGSGRPGSTPRAGAPVGGRVGFAAGDDQPAGDVVGAVAVLRAGRWRAGRARTGRCRRSAGPGARSSVRATAMPARRHGDRRRAVMRGRSRRLRGDGRCGRGAGRRAPRSAPATAGQSSVGGQRTGAADEAGGQAGLGQDPPDGGGQRRRVPVRHEQAGAVGEQLDGVREGGGDHRDAGGDRLDEHAGGDLLAGVVRAARPRRRSGSAGPARSSSW